MVDISDFDIPFVKLKFGHHKFDYDLTDDFLTLFEQDLVTGCNIKVDLDFTKEASLFNFVFDIKGTVKLNCDRCLADLDYPINTSYSLMAKITEYPGEENEELIYIHPGDIKVNVATHIYDTLMLALPMVRYCTDIAGKKCDEDVVNKLSALNDKPEDEGTDPRWDDLKNLLK